MTSATQPSGLFGLENPRPGTRHCDHRGLFELAGSGTLFLVDVADLVPHSQLRLLRVLRERKLMPAGSAAEREIDVRVVAATDRDLRREVTEGRFREDLCEELEAVRVNLPPLRERRGDILMLAQWFIEEHAPKLRKRVRDISPAALEKLEAHPWHRNVRELGNVIERAVMRAHEGLIQPSDIAL